ncbi:HAMP domain-containing protein [Rhodanobacter glycinis]|uniref:histidine kinase n=1 Tax=Rhodanobacter glycinis TaxID=582702 RepID=A0A5B9DUC0_9GAMM|nr:sensor histidine kinase [Rhodanobacter glycinis]QEE23102.1 HAMP domain-containing protein [Rhodanobacter glycinis]
MATVIASRPDRIRHRQTSAFRLALILAGMFALFSMLTAAVLWLGTEREAQSQQREELRADARDLTLLSYQQGLDGLSTEIEERIILGSGLPRWYALYAANGVKLAGDLDDRLLREGWSTERFTPRATTRLPAPSSHLLTLYTVRTVRNGWLVVGRDGYYIRQMQDVAARIFGLALLLIVAFSLLVGGLIGRQLLRRVGAMSEAAGRISDGDLTQRMPVRGSGDELDMIALTVNQMLDRIASLLADVRRLGADIAHDLRTPLTRLRQRLERLQRHPATASDGQLETSVDAALGEIDELLNVFQALLRISRVESGEPRSGFTMVDLAQLLEELMEAYAPVAESEAHVLRADIRRTPPVDGDRELLVQVFVNLIENAIRHTPPGTTVTLRLGCEAGVVRAGVGDNGPGIPAQARGDVLQPFMRLDRSRHTEGNGLGLALVRSVAELHGAALLLEDAKPGLAVSLEFCGVQGMARRLPNQPARHRAALPAVVSAR